MLIDFCALYAGAQTGLRISLLHDTSLCPPFPSRSSVSTRPHWWNVSLLCSWYKHSLTNPSILVFTVGITCIAVGLLVTELHLLQTTNFNLDVDLNTVAGWRWNRLLSPWKTHWSINIYGVCSSPLPVVILAMMCFWEKKNTHTGNVNKASFLLFLRMDFDDEDGEGPSKFSRWDQSRNI